MYAVLIAILLLLMYLSKVKLLINKMKVLIEDTITEFKKFLRVQHYDIDLSGQEDSIKQSCNIISISSSYANYLKDNDVIVFAKFNSELGQKEISAAKLCLTHGNRPHPIAGVLEVNPNFDFSLENNDLLFIFVADSFL